MTAPMTDHFNAKTDRNRCLQASLAKNCGLGNGKRRDCVVIQNLKDKCLTMTFEF